MRINSTTRDFGTLIDLVFDLFIASKISLSVDFYPIRSDTTPLGLHRIITSMTDSLSITVTVDATGTRCPIPLLKAKQALKTIEVGQYLEVLASDPSALGDFQAMLKHLPHELVEYELGTQDPRVDRFVILKNE